MGHLETTSMLRRDFEISLGKTAPSKWEIRLLALIQIRELSRLCGSTHATRTDKIACLSIGKAAESMVLSLPVGAMVTGDPAVRIIVGKKEETATMRMRGGMKSCKPGTVRRDTMSMSLIGSDSLLAETEPSAWTTRRLESIRIRELCRLFGSTRRTGMAESGCSNT